MALNWCRTFAIILALSQQILAEVLVNNGNDTQSVHNHHINSNNSNQHHITNDDLHLLNQPSKSDRTSLASSQQQNNNKYDNATHFLRLEDVLDIFSIEELAINWNSLNHQFHENCSRDMHEYFNGLKMQKIWAVKSE